MDRHHSVDVLKDEALHDGFRDLRLIEYYDRQSGIRAKRELVVSPHAVAVVAYDPRLDKLVMIRQFRYGAQLGTGKGMTAEIPAGMIDEGESPEQAAKRELQEEAGIEAETLVALCQFLTTPGLTNEVVHIFVAEVDARNLASKAGRADETEETFPFLVSLEEAFKAAQTNRINNGIVMLGLFWFERWLKEQKI